ncbi:hypothetical protein A9X04_12080 [Mycobacterium sp. E3247]|nr:hypothetical protein A9X04_12080 [Mycobacterium sp. E3247]
MTGGLEHMRRAHHVGGPRGDWLAIGPADQRLGSQVKDDLGPLGGENLTDCCLIANVDAMILDG